VAPLGSHYPLVPTEERHSPDGASLRRSSAGRKPSGVRNAGHVAVLATPGPSWDALARATGRRTSARSMPQTRTSSGRPLRAEGSCCARTRPDRPTRSPDTIAGRAPAWVHANATRRACRATATVSGFPALATATYGFGPIGSCAAGARVTRPPASAGGRRGEPRGADVLRTRWRTGRRARSVPGTRGGRRCRCAPQQACGAAHRGARCHHSTDSRQLRHVSGRRRDRIAIRARDHRLNRTVEKARPWLRKRT
jgi:hypothetical protein